MESLYLGIDPDKHGSCTFRNDTQVVTIPTPSLATGRGKRREIDETALEAVFRDVLIIMGGPKKAFAILEQQQPMIHVPTKKVNPVTGKRTTRAVSTGDALLGYGIWRGILACYHIRREYVYAHVWKKLMMVGLPKAETAAGRKQQSILIAHRLYPEVSLVRPGGKKDDAGIADSVLLMEYGRRLRGGEI